MEEMDQIIDSERAALFTPGPGTDIPVKPAPQPPDRTLREKGWAKFDLADLPFAKWHAKGFEAFGIRVAASLPPDPYDPTGRRHRRYSVFFWSPKADLLMPVSREFGEDGLPVTPYLQGDEYQTEFGNEVRWFPALEEWLLQSSILGGLIRADGMVARRAGVLPDAPGFYVGVHAIALVPGVDGPAVITPNEIHCDGEPVTFVHLLRRRNVTGGWNVVADRAALGRHPDEVDPALLHARFSLTMPGEGFVVDDRRVAHFVEGVALRDSALPGERTVLLIDLCPARRVLSHELPQAI
jgi:hypothetical protein